MKSYKCLTNSGNRKVSLNHITKFCYILIYFLFWGRIEKIFVAESSDFFGHRFGQRVDSAWPNRLVIIATSSKVVERYNEMPSIRSPLNGLEFGSFF